MDGDKGPLPLKDLIDPEHLFQAIDNSMEHSHETAHGITGLHFKNYTIAVHKRKGLCWYIELKFKRGERNLLHSLCRWCRPRSVLPPCTGSVKT
jgi:hypothetical protein